MTVRLSFDQLRENLKIAIDSLRVSRLRSGLTILGVVIGVATVMTMATIVRGIQDQILHTLEVAGPTTFYVMKIFSIFAVVFMPPTLIAGIYGMNFEHMPELKWLFGYPFALGLILASAVLPFVYARRKGWL